MRCWVLVRWPTLWNIMSREITSLIGRRRLRAACAASRLCPHGQSLPPKPEPRYSVTIRMFSGGTPSICLGLVAACQQFPDVTRITPVVALARSCGSSRLLECVGHHQRHILAVV